MNPLRRLSLLLRLAKAQHIARRYFVTNGFDGALTMLGLLTGFRLGNDIGIEAAFWACTGTAIALATSGISSAYISEAAERQKALRELEDAMAGQSLDETAHGHAARVVPLFIALVNGGAPLALAIFIILPIWLASQGVALPIPALDAAIAIAFGEIFLLGAFLGRIAGRRWYWMGLKTLAVAVVTALLILFLGR